MYFPALFMSGMLKVLQCLQFFWTYYIIRSYISVAVSSKLATHNYDWERKWYFFFYIVFDYLFFSKEYALMVLVYKKLLKIDIKQPKVIEKWNFNFAVILTVPNGSSLKFQSWPKSYLWVYYRLQSRWSWYSLKLYCTTSKALIL